MMDKALQDSFDQIHKKMNYYRNIDDRIRPL